MEAMSVALGGADAAQHRAAARALCHAAPPRPPDAGTDRLPRVVSADVCLYKLKVWGNHTLHESIGAIFPTAFCSLYVFVSYFGNSCNISNLLIIVSFVTLIFDQ